LERKNADNKRKKKVLPLAFSVYMVSRAVFSALKKSLGQIKGSKKHFLDIYIIEEI